MQDREYIKSGFQQKTKKHGSGEGAANIAVGSTEAAEPERLLHSVAGVFLVSKQSEALGTAPSQKFFFFQSWSSVDFYALSVICWGFWQIRTNRCHKSSPPKTNM